MFTSANTRPQCIVTRVLMFTFALFLFSPPTAVFAQTSTISVVNATGISGTAAGPNPVTSVDLAIRSGNQFWNGSSFQSGWTRVAASLTGSNWTYNIQPQLPPGTYYINSRAIDNTNSVQSPLTSYTFVQDTEKPDSTITSTSASAISGSATDNSGSVDRVEVAIRRIGSPSQYWNGTAFTANYNRVQAQLSASGNWLVPFSPALPAGDYAVSSVAFDATGNFQSPFDNTVFTILSPDNEAPDAIITNADELGIAGTASDNVAVDRVELAIRMGSSYWNGTSFGSYQRVVATLSGSGTDVDWDYPAQLPPGTYAVSALAIDTTGNIQQPFAYISFTIAQDDQIKPESMINPPGTVQSLSTITGIASDNIALNRVELSIRMESSGDYWNGTAFQGSYTRVAAQLDSTGQNANWTYTLNPPLPAGQYGMGSIAFDAVGNAQSPPDTTSFTVTGFVASTGNGVWSPPVTMPSIPVSAANLPDGRILTWASYNQMWYSYEQDNARTYTSIFDPQTNTSELVLVANTQHDMFCPGANILADGQVLINGGSSAARTSIYNPVTSNWSQAQTMNIPRAYQANTMLSDGSILTLGGSWKDLYNNMAGNKTAEVWNASSGWRVLNGIPADSMQTNDRDGAFRSDNHMWLFSVAGGNVLHAGPSRRMHMLDVSGNGSFTVVGNRADDNDAMNGNAIMQDIGKVLTLGGAPHYENSTATNGAFIIETDGNNVSSRRIASMNYRRVFHNSVVLPNGEVIVIGGQAAPIVFSDQASVMVPELWNPATEQFRPLAPMAVPRNYHSVAILLTDGRILAGGGGLCGTCTTNHPDVEIFTPPYLVDNNGNALSRPSIQSAPSSAGYGQAINVTTDSPVSHLVLMRASVVTHAVNNAQRRVPLSFVSTGTNSYQADIPLDSGIVTPGNYMLFALDQNGTPSLSRLINIQ